MNTETWESVATNPPPEGAEVLTKLHDEHGCRNVMPLVRRGTAWLEPGLRLSVQYEPTHWRYP